MTQSFIMIFINSRSIYAALNICSSNLSGGCCLGLPGPSFLPQECLAPVMLGNPPWTFCWQTGQKGHVPLQALQASSQSSALHLAPQQRGKTAVDLGTLSEGEITEAEGSNIQSKGVFLYVSLSHRREVVTKSIRQLLLLEIAFNILHSTKVVVD